MSKRKGCSPKYLEVLVKFGLAPDIKLDDYEKATVKYVGVEGKTILDIALEFDLKPSEAKDIVKKLIKKGLAEKGDDDIVRLTDVSVKYINSSKKERKSEKKFRKFINCLSEEDLSKFLELVNSFVVSDGSNPEDILSIAKEIKKAPGKKLEDKVREAKKNEVKPLENRADKKLKETK